MRAPILCLILLAACGDDTSTGDDIVEDTVPDTSFAAVPDDDLDNADDSVFELACERGPCTFECSLDDGAFAACDEVLALDYLAVGEHTLAARAIDDDGDVDETPATHTWSLVFGWRALAGAERTMCAIAGDGALYCWGAPIAYSKNPVSYARPTQVGTDRDWETIVAGNQTLCGRRSGATYCWGDNDDGALGDPALIDSVVAPTLVAHDFAQLSLGDNHSCAIDDAGALWCFGDGYDFALGTGNEDSQPAPVRVGTGTWAQVSAGSNATCGVDTDGALWCWGENGAGNGGQDPLDEILETPTRVGTRTDWVSVHLAAGHTCALDDADGLWCWGYGGYGALGDGTTTSTFTPVQVPGAWRDVLPAYTGTCAVAVDGAVSCWGDNTRAQLGSTVPVAQTSTPTPIDSDAAYSYVVGRKDLHCALGDRDIVCWGDNQNASGALGRGVLGGEPQVIAIDGGWSQVAVNPSGGCGVRTNGTLACWGLGFHVGQDVALAHAPVDVDAQTTWFQVDVTAAGNLAEGHACGVSEDGLWCWGTNNAGQIGDGTTSLRTRPVEIAAPLEAWNQVATGQYATCAITTGGRLYCWGGPSSVTTPTAVTTPAATGWSTIRIFDRRYTAIRTDGTLWAWGMNGNGLLQTTPVQLGTDTDWAEAISTVGGNTCARKTSGALYCTDLVFQPTWPRAMLQVGTATDHGALLPHDGGVCTLRVGVLHCHWGNTGWPDNFPNLDVNGILPNPTGTWASMSNIGYQMRCGIRADGTRECAGGRFAGSLGDGFDERLPTATLLP